MRDDYQKIVRPYLLELIESGIDSYAEIVRPSVKMDMIRWSYALCHAGYYEDFENNIRYLKFYLAKRLRYLDFEWLGEETEYGLEGTGETHTVVFYGGLGTESFEVLDGECITATPEYLLDEGEWWFEQRNGRTFSSYLPVYEDITFSGEVSED